MEYPDGHVSPGLFGPVLRVGWLGPKHPGGTGDARGCLPSLLKLFDTASVSATRGHHMCHFCCEGQVRRKPGASEHLLPRWLWPQASFGERYLGSAELVVRGTQGRVFTVPDMIIHYIDAHNYLPPQEFVDACLADLGPFGLTPGQIAEGIMTQDQRTLTAVFLGPDQTSVLREFLEFYLAEMLLDIGRYVPGELGPTVRSPRNRWRDVALVDVFANPYAGREWLYQLIDRLDPGVTRGVLQRWLDETQTWATASTVFPVAATESYRDPSAEGLSSFPPGR